MANVIKDVVVSESAPVGKPGCLWIKYTPGTDSYQMMLPVGSGWQETNETLSKKEVEDGLGYTPENNSNKVTSISVDSTDVQYPSAKAVYSAIQEGGGGGLNKIVFAKPFGQIESDIRQFVTKAEFCEYYGITAQQLDDIMDGKYDLLISPDGDGLLAYMPLRTKSVSSTSDYVTFYSPTYDQDVYLYCWKELEPVKYSHTID